MSHTRVGSGMENPNDTRGETFNASSLSGSLLKSNTKQDSADHLDQTKTVLEENMCNQCESVKKETNGCLPETCDETHNSEECKKCNSENILEKKPNGQNRDCENGSVCNAANSEAECEDETDPLCTDLGASYVPYSDIEILPDVDAEDLPDGLIRKIFCGKSKTLDEDKQPYGFEKNAFKNDRHKPQTLARNTSYSSAVDPNSVSVSLNRQHSHPREENVSPRRKNSGKMTMGTQGEIDSDCYYFSHPERGYMLIIVNERFYQQPLRDGALRDLRNMRAIARKFGFRILNYQRELDLDKKETMYWLGRARATDHSDCDCFTFVISTHGYEQKNALVGGREDHALVCSDDQTVFTSTITDMFNDENCPSLKNKPKFFFIQACRGESLDHGAQVKVLETKGVDKTCSVTKCQTRAGNRRSKSFDVCDTKPLQDTWAGHFYPDPPTQGEHNYRTVVTATINQERAYEPTSVYHKEHNTAGILHHSGVTKYSAYSRESRFNSFVKSHTQQSTATIKEPNVTPYAIVDTPSIKCDNDMLVLYAIPPGYFAWRNSVDGSWMISYLHQILMAYDFDKPRNFLSVLTKVNAEMSKRTTNTPQNDKLHEKKAISVIEHKLTRDVFFRQKFKMSSWKNDRFLMSL